MTNPVGRPTAYNDEIAEKICEHLAAGWSLVRTCQQEGYPNASTVFTWQQKHPEFREKYEDAQQRRTEFLSEQLTDIADETTGDVQRDKLRVDTRKWVLARMNPKRWGDRVETNHTGSVEIQQIKRTIVDSKP
jgi:hypothetical protein